MDVLNILQWLVFCSMNIISMYKSSIVHRGGSWKGVFHRFFIFSIAKDPDKSYLRERGFGGTYRHREIVYPGQEDVVAGTGGWLGHIAPILRRQRMDIK